MKHKPIHEHMDGRGMSVDMPINEIVEEERENKIGKMMGKSYFTNPNESIESTHEYQHDDRRPEALISRRMVLDLIDHDKDYFKNKKQRK